MTEPEARTVKRASIPLTRACAVCGSPAPEHLHFGGVCCYSCRIFFRRTIERINKKGLKRCKTGKESCRVATSGKNCINCRYKKCLSIGMVPDLLRGKRKKGAGGGEEEASTNPELEENSSEEAQARDSGEAEAEVVILHTNHPAPTSQVDGVDVDTTLQHEQPTPDHFMEPGPSSRGTGQHPVIARPSVITSSISRPGLQLQHCRGRPARISTILTQDPLQRKMESEMLRKQGEALMRAGQMMHNQADLIDVYADSIAGINPVTLPLGLRSSVIKDVKTEQTEQCLWRTLAGNEEHAEKSIIQKEDDLAATDPFNVGMMKVLDGYNLDMDTVDVDKMLLSTLEEIENKQQSSHCDKSAIEINKKIEVNKVDEEMTVVGCEGSLNVLKEPIMRLTEEETNRLQLLINDTQFTLRKCCPVFLFQARVGQFLGTLSVQEMMKVFTLSRQAQNYFHYKTMFAMPFFNELSTKAQNYLIVENKHTCFSVNSSFYFFGHNGNTAIEQETQTGLMTGLVDFIVKDAPFARSLPDTKYDEYFRPPWASSRELEQKHRFILKETGNSLQDVGYIGYILLYALALFNAPQGKLLQWDLPHKDREIIETAQSNLETLYSRFLRDKVGWKKASHRYLNQKYLLAQLHECMLIYTMENLQIDELSSSIKNNPFEAMT